MHVLDPLDDRHPGLLDPGDLRRLKPVLELLRERQPELLDRWWRLYSRRFAGQGSLDALAFREVYGRELRRMVERLLAGDLDRFDAAVRTANQDLVERGVPFAERLVSIQLFEDAAVAELDELRSAADRSGFDQVTARRILLLAGSYFSERSLAEWAGKGDLGPQVPTLAGAERNLIERALAATAGNKVRAAKMLAISRHRLYDKLRKYDLGL